MSNHLICLTLWKIEIGKTSFNNAITGKKDYRVSPDAKAWTITYNIIEMQRIGEKLVFIGLNYSKGEENNIRKVTDAIAEHPNFSTFLVLLNFNDSRLSESTVSTLTQYIKIFPIQDFWEHTIIFRKHAKKYDEDIEDEKKI